VHYREAIVWQKAMQAADEVYRLVPCLPKEEIYGMRSQITRSMVSVPANIAEGWTRDTSRDKAHFLAIAQGSLAETGTLLSIRERQKWFAPSETGAFRQLLDEISRILTTLRRNRRTK
jgi:four helix bundle protein